MVLWAWSLFVLAGLVVPQTTQHWQSGLPSGGHLLASGSFAALQALAVIAAVLVLAGVLAAAPGLLTFLRAGRFPEIRCRTFTAAGLAALLAAATAGLTTWAGELTPFARNGGDPRYSAAFVAWAVLGAATLLGWTKAATAVAEQLSFTSRVARLHARLTAAIAVAMGAMTAATVAWWAAVAASSPGALNGAPAAHQASPAVPGLIAAATVMVLSTALATSGARFANAASCSR